jgi:Domain of unknown function (DUF397)
MSSFEAGSTTQPHWRTASLCTGGECIEVAQVDDLIMLRDSLQPRGDILHWTVQEWRSFIVGIRAGKFDDLRALANRPR